MKQTVIAALFLTLLVWHSSARAESSDDQSCENAYVDLLKKAQQALTEEKREAALSHLLKATELLEACASLPESPWPQRQGKANVLASIPSISAYLECSLSSASISLASTDSPALIRSLSFLTFT
jgi:hypothetical protein